MEVNQNVAEASNKNTMNQNKRKTTTPKNTIVKPIEASKKKTKKVVNAGDAGTLKKSKSSKKWKANEGKLYSRPTTEEDLARYAFMLEYMREYFEKHPGVIWLPDEESRAANEKFNQLVKMPKSNIVEEYLKKYKAENSIMKPLEASKKTTKKVVNAWEPKGELTERPVTEEDLARKAFMV